MSLDKRVVDVPLIDGLSDDDDDFASDPPGFQAINDARWLQDKQIGKRNGIAALCQSGDGSLASTVENPNQAIDLDGIGYLLTNSGVARATKDAGTVNTVSPLNNGSPRPSRVISNALVRINFGCAKPDAAICGDTMCCVWDQVSGDGSVVGAFYGFWDVSTDVPRPLSQPTLLASITNSCRVIGLAGRYFILVGLSAINNGLVYIATYDKNALTYTFAAPVSTGDNVTAGAANNQFALAPSYDASSNAWLAYCKSATGVIRLHKLSTAGAIVASKNMIASSCQHIVHNGPISKVVLINVLGSIEYVDDLLAGASTALTLFTDPASGVFAGKWSRASIGLADTAGNMLLARSTSDFGQVPYATQIAKVSSVFAISAQNLVGGVVLAGHFSPLILDDANHGTSYLAVANQGALVTTDSPVVSGNPTPPAALKAQPVSFVVRLVSVSGVLRMVTCGRYGQDAIDLTGNAGVSTPGTGSVTSHLPHLAYDQTAAKASRRLIVVYPVRTVDGLGGTGGVTYKRAVDMAAIVPMVTTPTRNVQSQALRVLGGGFGATSLDGQNHVEMTPPAPEWLTHGGFDAATGGNSGYTFAPVIPPNVQDHIDYTGYVGINGWGPGPGYTENPNQQWGFCVCWRYVDAKGNTHRGAPSSVYYTTFNKIVNVANGATVTTRPMKLCFPPWRPVGILGDTQITAEVEIYACPPDGNGDFRLLGIVTPITDDADEGRVFVDITHGATPTSYSVALYGWDAAAYSAGAPAPRSLYTTAFAGSELAAEPAPALLSICSTQSRLWGLNAEDRLDVWYTKPVALGFAPEFNSSLRVRIPQEGGPAVGIAALDDKVVVFKRTKVFVIEGDPGDAAGNGSSLRPPRLVSSDVGCDSVESIIEGPFGVVFHSDRGFFTLDRGLSYAFVGDKVMQQLTVDSLSVGGRSIVSACIIPQETEVRFIANVTRGDTTAGHAIGLTWNYRLNRWTRRDTLAGLFNAAVNGVEWQCSEPDPSAHDYTITIETPNSWAVSIAALTLRTNWIKLNGIAGFGRVWRIVFVLRYFDHDIRIRCAQDYQTETESWATWSQAELTAMADSSGRLELSVKPTVQKCGALQLLIEEVITNADVGTGRGFELIGVTLECGIKRGANKRIAAGGRK